MDGRVREEEADTDTRAGRSYGLQAEEDGRKEAAGTDRGKDRGMDRRGARDTGRRARDRRSEPVRVGLME